jgi:DNA-binding MarR family transcriptional regulator
MTRTDEPDYERLFNFRKELRRFLHGSEAAARAVGLTPAQHQLLLAIKGHAGNPPTIADVAEDLMLRHDSVSELIRRAADAGIVDRQIDREDHRLTRLHITASGQSLLRQLTRQHVDEIRRLAPVVDALRVG